MTTYMDSDCQPYTDVCVSTTVPAPTTTTTVVSREPLPDTGFNSADIAAPGLLLILIGAVIVAAVHSRRS